MLRNRMKMRSFFAGGSIDYFWPMFIVYRQRCDVGFDFSEMVIPRYRFGKSGRA